MGKSLRDRLHLSACHASCSGVSLAITAATSSQPKTAVLSPCLTPLTPALAAHCPAQRPWLRNREADGLATVRAQSNMPGSTSQRYLSSKACTRGRGPGKRQVRPPLSHIS
jgi:hypothetical protein